MWGKLRKVLAIFGIVLLSIIILLIAFISPIAKYAIEKNSVEWTGRKIRMDDLRLNLLNGTLRIVNLKVFELDGKSVFVGCGEMATTINVGKLFKSEYEVQELKFNKLNIVVSQSGDKFNFDDIIKKFASTDTIPQPKSEPVKYWLKNLRIANSNFLYKMKDRNIDYELQKLDVKCPLIAWDKSKMHYEYSLSLKSGGDIKGDFNFDLNSMKYDTKIDSKNINLSVLYPYLKEFIDVNKFEGLLNTDLFIKGDVDDAQDILAKGTVEVNKILLTDNTNTRLASLEKFKLDIDSLNLKSEYHEYKIVLCDGLYIIYEIYDNGDNWTRLMPVSTSFADSTVEGDYDNPFAMMAAYLGDLTREYMTSTYKINELSIKNAEIQFNDFTLHDRFSYHMDQMNLTTKRLNTNNDRVVFDFNSRMNTTGDAVGKLSIDPKNYQDLELKFDLRNFPFTSTNPYMVFYMAYPFSKSDLFYSVDCKIENGKLVSNNKIVMKHPVVGRKVNSPTAMSIPLKLAVSLLKNVDGNIELEIPVSGDLNNPKFKLGKVVWQILKNIMMKAIAAPGNLIARIAGGKVDDFKEFYFDYTSPNFSEKVSKNLVKLGKVLSSRTEMKVVFQQNLNAKFEMEQLAINHSKRQFVKSGMNDSSSIALDSISLSELEKVSVKDSSFIKFIDSKLGLSGTIMAIQQKCLLLLGNEKWKELQAKLVVDREIELKRLLKEGGYDEKYYTIIAPKLTIQEQLAPTFTYEVKADDSDDAVTKNK